MREKGLQFARTIERTALSTNEYGQSFLAFARQHTFAAIFGVATPILVFCTFVGYPIVYTIYLSFFEWNGMTPTKKFVGIDNYIYLFHDKYVYVSVLNNFRWLAVTLLFPVTVGFLIAYIMRAKLVYGAAFLRTLVFFPVTMRSE